MVTLETQKLLSVARNHFFSFEIVLHLISPTFTFTWILELNKRFHRILVPIPGALVLCSPLLAADLLLNILAVSSSHILNRKHYLKSKTQNGVLTDHPATGFTK